MRELPHFRLRQTSVARVLRSKHDVAQQEEDVVRHARGRLQKQLQQNTNYKIGKNEPKLECEGFLL